MVVLSDMKQHRNLTPSANLSLIAPSNILQSQHRMFPPRLVFDQI